MSEEADSVPLREKIEALTRVARYRPKFTGSLILFGMMVALLEGLGLTFIIPIIEIIQAADPVAEASGPTAVFLSFYQLLGVPFTLGHVIVGVSVVMVFRYTSSFVYNWLRYDLRFSYHKHIQTRGFQRAMNARMSYFDEEGSDEILNAIITESEYASAVINYSVTLMNAIFLTIVYLLIALFISPLLTVVSAVVLGGISFFMRRVVNPGYELGDRVAEAHERRQETAQAGLLGIRDVSVFNLADEMYQKFADTVTRFTEDKVKIKRNEVAINQFYKLSVAVFVFVLIYLALRFANLSFGELGVFLFAMFQLGPRVSTLNKRFYQLEKELPHLVRTQQFLDKLEAMEEPKDSDREVPKPVQSVTFDSIGFSYGDDDTVLRSVSFSVKKGDFVAFVGQSGAGKSTIVSLLVRHYEPDRGRIYANDVPVDELNPDEWRERVAVVRQNPHIFGTTLRRNLTVGNRDATQQEIDRACEISRVDEFIDKLPAGYDSQLGDDGVKLSGGQKQRLAVARALLKDADILVLDEATSDLDSNLEKDVQQAIEAMDRNYAIIAIAHRLSTVENADRIYTLENGRIVEQGAHGELIENSGKYAELYSIQSRT